MELNLETIKILSGDRNDLTADAAKVQLRFSGKNIVIIAHNVFHQYRNLRNLFLSFNYIQNLPQNVFGSLENLEEIDLSDNKIVELRENIFSRNEKLEKIWLQNNEIEVIHQSTFSNLKQLKELMLNNNHIQILPKNLFHSNSELIRIDLCENLIEELEPNIFSQNKKLEVLIINNNQIKSVHNDTFQQLPELKIFSIRNNSLQSFNFSDLKSSNKLERLWFYNNELQEIKEINNFKTLFPQLNTVSLSGNKFEFSTLKMMIESLEEQGIDVDFIDKSKGEGKDHVYGIQCLPDTNANQMEVELHQLNENDRCITSSEFNAFQIHMMNQMLEKNNEIANLVTMNAVLEANVVELKSKMEVIEEIIQGIY